MKREVKRSLQLMLAVGAMIGGLCLVVLRRRERTILVMRRGYASNAKNVRLVEEAMARRTASSMPRTASGATILRRP